MWWKGLDRFMFALGIVLIIVYLAVNFSLINIGAGVNADIDIGIESTDTVKAILLSFIVGIVVFLLFVFFAGLSLPPVSGSKRLEKDEKKEKLDKDARIFIDKIKKRKTMNHIGGLVLMIIVILLFLNFYLYFKAMLGNDMLVSLKVDNANFVIKNGEGEKFNVKAKVLTNPFCEANCSLVLEDLSNGQRLYSDEIYIQVSSPLSKDYFVSSNDETSGQRLYKVTLECSTIRGRFCYASTFAETNTSNSRTKLISVDHELNDVQKIRKEELRNETETLNRQIYTIQNKLNNLELNFSFLDLSELEDEARYLENASYLFLNKINNLNNLYENQKYYELGTKVFSIKEEVKDFENRFNELNASLMSNINVYNSLAENVSLMHENISYLEEYSFSNSSILPAERFVSDFNSMTQKLREDTLLESKIILFNYVNSEKEDLFSILKNESSSGIFGENNLNISIFNVNLQKILIKENNYVSDFSLREPSPICCFMNECYKCIDDSSVNYPVILVHGHSFNEKLSAELSMEAFSDMARELEKDGYLDGGYFYGSQYDEISHNYLGRVNVSVVVEATYYINASVTEEGSFILDSKWENVDTYAERLNEIIYNVKYLTGKDKVIIVAHSMGGLVTRRYMQLYGTDSVDRVVLVGIPNHGVDGFVIDYCPVFGADIECSEMNKYSLFLAELNKDPPPEIPIYNIIGLGCFWEESIGDGIVKNQSAYLSGTENIYVNGTCRGVDFFHVNMIKPSKYPEIYNIIKEKIRQ